MEEINQAIALSTWYRAVFSFKICEMIAIFDRVFKNQLDTYWRWRGKSANPHHWKSGKPENSIRAEFKQLQTDTMHLEITKALGMTVPVKC